MWLQLWELENRGGLSRAGGERPPAKVWVRAAMKQLPPGNHLLSKGQTLDWISHDPCPHLIIQDWGIRTYSLSMSPGVPREACRDPQDRDLRYNLQWSPFTITAFVYSVKHLLCGKSHSQNSSSCFSVQWTMVNAETHNWPKCKSAKAISGLSPQIDICAIPPIH